MVSASPSPPLKPSHTAKWIAIGLLAGILAGVLFGEYCAPLNAVGMAYIGLLQMTVLPYLVLSLVSKTARLNLKQAGKLVGVAVTVLLLFWAIGIFLVVVTAEFLPAVPGAAFFSSGTITAASTDGNVMQQYIPANVFRALSSDYVPAIVVFCLFSGAALMAVPNKEPLLEVADVCLAVIGQINGFLVRLAPFGLFAITADAAGTLRADELSRLQAYLIIFTLACVTAAFGALPLLVSSLTPVRYLAFLRAAQEPLLTAIAAGKLFVVLPQIADACDKLIDTQPNGDADPEHITTGVLVPLAYPFPHVGKILTFTFVSFAAWYVGQELNSVETTSMAATGAVSSFASPLVTIPFLLDVYHLPQDLMALFLVPGVLTTRLGDVVGVVHLMALTIIVSRVMKHGLKIHWPKLAASSALLMLFLMLAGAASRVYLATTSLEYDLDKRVLSLQLPEPHSNTAVYRDPTRVPMVNLEGSTFKRLQERGVLRVGYVGDRIPYSFFNDKDELVGMDVDLMHRLANRLDVRLEFVPYSHQPRENYKTATQLLESGEIDVAIGGVLLIPSRLLKAGFTESYTTATAAVLVPDFERERFAAWSDEDDMAGVTLGTISADIAVAMREHGTHAKIETITSYEDYFEGKYPHLDGLLIPAEEGAVWCILHPDYDVVIPRPIFQRPVSMAVPIGDEDWLRVLNQWQEFERQNGDLEKIRQYWIEGGGTKEQQPRWSVMQNVLGWLP